MKSTVVDPWGSGSGCEEDDQATTVEMASDSTLCFEDSFVAGSTDSLSPSLTGSSSHLPDSAEYLASLENKLERLKSKRKGKDIVHSLEERNKSSMMNFLASDTQSVLGDEDFILDTPINSSHPIMRYVAPDKQALTLGELVELLKADHLSQVLEQEDLDDERKLHEVPN